MEIKKILWSIFVSITCVSVSYALYYGIPINITGENIQGVTICSGDTPFPDNAIFPVDLELINMPSKYLKIVDNKIVERTVAEKEFADLPIKYKKEVNNIWVEMSAEEKQLVDLPDKYKNQDGSEMSTEDKNTVDIDIETTRQASKPELLKRIENMYIIYLTNDWTRILQTNGLIETNVTINVTNATYEQNMIYLMSLRTLDKNSYINYVTEFKIFEDTLKNKFNSELIDCVWHPEVAD